MTNAYPQLITPSLLPQPNTPPIKHAIYKAKPEHFIVEEQLNIDLTKHGEHYWLLVKKIGINTTHIATQLAKWAKIPARDVGYSGLKDRHAVTTQWFSLRLPTGKLPDKPFAICDDENDGKNKEYAEVLQADWHNKKLNRGTHKANRFVLTLTEVMGDKDEIEKTLTFIATNGVPNYFGEQRFGRDGNNIASVLEWFEQGTLNGKPVPTVKNGRLNKRDKQIARKNKELQSILLSAARSAIFNQITAKRVQDGSWNTGMDGEVFNLAGTGSVFVSDTLDDELKKRLETKDIHPTGAMWGIANTKTMPTGQAKTLEEDVIKHNDTLQKLANGLVEKEIKTMRRPLRLLVNDLSWQWNNKKTLTLDFKLEAGSFATSVLAGLIEKNK